MAYDKEYADATPDENAGEIGDQYIKTDGSATYRKSGTTTWTAL